MCVNTSAGKAGELIDRGDNTYGGKFVINPSGGLISKGHPLGATGTLSLCLLMKPSCRIPTRFQKSWDAALNKLFMKPKVITCSSFLTYTQLKTSWDWGTKRLGKL